MPAPAELVQALLPWFAQSARDLPWRKTHDPYAIWISEIMLQQTQVRTVVPYWQRWMRRFPDIPTLASAPLEQVLKLWEGLGYYSRAKNLHVAARRLHENHCGRFPQEFEALLALPGIGRYTAGAICSIAFNQPVPVLDGNVIRVLTRIFGISGNVRTKRVNDRLWELAGRLVETAAHTGLSSMRPCSNLNQGLMELGATLCRPQNPACGACPANSFCIAQEKGRIGSLPNLGARPKVSKRRFVAFVAERRGLVLVRQRPTGVVNAELWELPNVELNGSRQPLRNLAQLCLGFPINRVQRLGTIHHSITRFRIELAAYRVIQSARQAPGQTSGRWCNMEELNELAFASAHRKILRVVERKRQAELFSGGNHNRGHTTQSHFHRGRGPIRTSS